MSEFLLRAFLGGVGVALAAGPIGAFLIWQRMAFFGAALAHSALLGVALGLVIGFDLNVGIVVAAVGMAALLGLAERRRRIAGDTLLSILAHGALAVGLVAMAFAGGRRVDLVAYLFGDILSVGRGDLYWIWGGGIAILATLAAIWRPLLSLTVQAEIARVEGVPVVVVRVAFMTLVALTVAVALKVVGLLLITALLIVPAATARRFSATPETMALSASAIGVLAVGLGLWGSLAWDTPTGPSIVVAALAIFAVVWLVPGRALGRSG